MVYVSFLNGRGRCGCVYGTKGAVDRKSLGTTALSHSTFCVSFYIPKSQHLLVSHVRCWHIAVTPGFVFSFCNCIREIDCDFLQILYHRLLTPIISYRVSEETCRSQLRHLDTQSEVSRRNACLPLPHVITPERQRGLLQQHVTLIQLTGSRNWTIKSWHLRSIIFGISSFIP
jgi:hypothetical protein